MNAKTSANVTKPNANRTISHVVKLIRYSPANSIATDEIQDDLQTPILHSTILARSAEWAAR
jgi:hypothetical protein